jgi:CRP-like cAMP-binding protein
MDDNLGTLVPTRAAFITHEAIRSFLHAHPRIGDVFWRYTLIDAAAYREWIAGLGRREGYARIAHLLCELFVRLRAVGLTQGEAFEMHITQSEFGDALGLSTVHVNRTLQRLRASGLISTPHAGNFIINNWNGLQKLCEFDPAYLHLRKHDS